MYSKSFTHEWMNDSLIIYKTDWMNEHQFDHLHMDEWRFDNLHMNEWIAIWALKQMN